METNRACLHIKNNKNLRNTALNILGMTLVLDIYCLSIVP